MPGDTRYDPALRRKGVRKQREAGVWLYVPAAVLREAGFEDGAPVPHYRLWPRRKRTVLVQLYVEP